ncbi:hypothetical protein F0L17_05045 [Streptomyces sp. TRM43335]|uniref:Alanine-rich protein n=1 Tax=Streptomyces taklimakanensis TaxID=2569853 RepID=A0A6G2B899_9ACTN|nr:hypothetical protein [Streptomyces taklimakanensis]MTE18505.1 hypothetical protein [Streptomyces taklimakanensis]
MRASAFVYPWDVVGDPDAAHRIADLGVRQVTLASAYHSTRALTPRHPRHRIVTARHSAVYHPVDPARWEDAAPGVPRPYPQDWTAGDDPYGEAAAALAGAGLEVHSWVILAHNTRLGEEHPRLTVRNAYGDRYPWAPCIARQEVRDYAARLAADSAVRPGARGTELESCGWYGLPHLNAHDKTGGVRLGGAGQYLMSLCFCEVCEAGYAAHGADPGRLRSAVTEALGPLWAGEREDGATGREQEWEEVVKLLGEELAGAAARWRDRVAGAFRGEVVRAVRDAARVRGAQDFRVLLHADPAPHRCGANVGVDPAGVLGLADGVVLPCTGDDAERVDVLSPFLPHRTPATVLAANLTVVSGMGGRPRELVEHAAHARESGANELRLYHAGLAGEADLAAVRAALARLG